MIFAEKFVRSGSRARDQIEQAARSGRQNIAEGSEASRTSKESEIKLTNVAKASLEELLLDYEDYLRQHNLIQWGKDYSRTIRLREYLKSETFLSDPTKFVNRLNAEEFCNLCIMLINQTIDLFKRLIDSQQQQFLEQDGIKEQMYRARANYRSPTSPKHPINQANSVKKANDFIFSYAENSAGKMVHIDAVPRGLKCDCKCPYCHEPLVARHGNIKAHGFAHHSDNRGANLSICYMVALYKVAEQIIQTNMRIKAPGYYDILPPEVIEFVDVRIDGCFEREDKQPDVVATTADGRKYLIEFIFDYKIQHKQAIDYKNLNCIEINLSGQSFETIEKFLLEDDSNRVWLNNQDYFDNLESFFEDIAPKDVRECEHCTLERLGLCTAATIPDSREFRIIENSGQRYRLCYTDDYRARMDERQRAIEDEEKRKRERERIAAEREAQRIAQTNIQASDPSKRTCFMCRSNCSWVKNNDGSAYCGLYKSLGVPRNTPPETAQNCIRFKPIEN